MWQHLLTSLLILSRRHINSSNLITRHLKFTCLFLHKTDATFWATIRRNSSEQCERSPSFSPRERSWTQQQNGRAVLWFRQFVLGISPRHPGFDRKPVDPVGSVSFLHTLLHFSLHCAPHSSHITAQFPPGTSHCTVLHTPLTLPLSFLPALLIALCSTLLSHYHRRDAIFLDARQKISFTRRQKPEITILKTDFNPARCVVSWLYL